MVRGELQVLSGAVLAAPPFFFCPVSASRGFSMLNSVVVPEMVKGLFSWLLGANSRLGSLSRGRARTCQIVGVTVNIHLHMFKRFLNLYIFGGVAIGWKMYNPEKCNPLPRRLLTVTPEKILNFFCIFVLTFPASGCILSPSTARRATQDASASDLLQEDANLQHHA